MVASGTVAANLAMEVRDSEDTVRTAANAGSVLPAAQRRSAPATSASGPRRRMLREQIGVNLADDGNAVPAAGGEGQPAFVVCGLRRNHADRRGPVQRVKRPKAIQPAAKRPANREGNDSKVLALPAVLVGMPAEHDDRHQPAGHPSVQLARIVELSLHRFRVGRRPEESRVATDLHHVKGVRLRAHGVAASCTGHVKIGRRASQLAPEGQHGKHVEAQIAKAEPRGTRGACEVHECRADRVLPGRPPPRPKSVQRPSRPEKTNAGQIQDCRPATKKNVSVMMTTDSVRPCPSATPSTGAR